MITTDYFFVVVLLLLFLDDDDADLFTVCFLGLHGITIGGERRADIRPTRYVQRLHGITAGDGTAGTQHPPPGPHGMSGVRTA